MSSPSDSIEDRKALREMAVEMPSHPLKRCDGTCGIFCEVADAERYFDRDSQSKDGFKKICKACRSEQAALHESADALKQLQHIDRSILRRLANARPGGPNVPHSADLLERIYTIIGGANGMAALLMKTFMQAAPGSPTQQKILAQIMALTHQNTEVGGAKKPVDLLSDEEVDAEIERLLKAKSVPMDQTHTLKILPDDFEDEDDELDLREAGE